LWPWLCGACLIASLVLFVGSLIMISVFDYIYINAGFFSSLFLVTFVLLVLTVVAAFARDASLQGSGREQQ
jgi:hypothetical protein